MKTTLEDKILLQFGDERKHLQPHEIDADRADKEAAIARLVSLGYVEARENQSTHYDRYVFLTLTDEGKNRQRELLRLMSRSVMQLWGDSGRTALRWCRNHAGKAAWGLLGSVMAGLIIAYLSRMLGLI